MMATLPIKKDHSGQWVGVDLTWSDAMSTRKTRMASAPALAVSRP